MKTQELLNQVKTIENRLDILEDILNSAPKGQFGLTLGSAKTDDWRKAKSEHNKLFAQLRNANQALNKVRKCVGFAIENGKRVTVYKYSA